MASPSDSSSSSTMNRPPPDVELRGLPLLLLVLTSGRAPRLRLPATLCPPAPVTLQGRPRRAPPLLSSEGTKSSSISSGSSWRSSSSTTKSSSFSLHCWTFHDHKRHPQELSITPGQCHFTFPHNQLPQTVLVCCTSPGPHPPPQNPPALHPNPRHRAAQPSQSWAHVGQAGAHCSPVRVSSWDL